jgi:hypothetical protein
MSTKNLNKFLNTELENYSRKKVIKGQVDFKVLKYILLFL